MSEKVPTGQEVSGGRKQVGYGQQRDDLLRGVSYVLEEEVGEEDEKGSEHGERAADDGAVGRYATDVEADQPRARGTLVRCRTSRRRSVSHCRFLAVFKGEIAEKGAWPASFQNVDVS